MVKKCKSDTVFNLFMYVTLGLVLIVCVFPLLYVVSVSLTPISEVHKNGGFLVIPKSVTLDAYRAIVEQKVIPRAMKVTAFITIVGTTINIVATVIMAYPLSRRNLAGRKYLIPFVIFPMIFSGGTIPNYLLIKNLNLIGTYWALLLPGAIWTLPIDRKSVV